MNDKPAKPKPRIGLPPPLGLGLLFAPSYQGLTALAIDRRP